jgi:hypothetical protein
MTNRPTVRPEPFGGAQDRPVEGLTEVRAGLDRLCPNGVECQVFWKLQ